MKNISKRLAAFIDSLGMTKNAFANAVGTSSSLISKLTTKDVDLRASLLVKIKAVYPELNLDWLLTGKGEMNGLPTGGIVVNTHPAFPAMRTLTISSSDEGMKIDRGSLDKEQAIRIAQTAIDFLQDKI